MEEQPEKATETPSIKPARPLHVAFVLVGILLISSPVWLVWMASCFPGLNRADSLHIAQLSRNLAEGRGYVTSVVIPLSLQEVPELENHPELRYEPLYPIVQSLFYKLHGAKPPSSALASGAAWMLALMASFLFGCRVGGLKLGIFTTVLLLINPAALHLAVSGLPPTLSMLLVTALFWLFCTALKPFDPNAEESPRPPYVRCAVSGLLVGLMALTDYDLFFAVLLPVLLFWTGWPAFMGLNQPLHFRSSIQKGGRLKTWFAQRMAPRAGGLFLVLVLLVTLPWMIRNAAITGSPIRSLHRFEVLTQTKDYPGSAIFRYYEQPGKTASSAVFTAPGDMMRKGLSGFTRVTPELSDQVSPWILFLFAAAVFLPAAPATRRLIRFSVAILVLYAVKICFYDQALERLCVFAPVMTVLSLAVVVNGLPERSGMSRKRRSDSKAFVLALRRLLLHRPRRVFMGTLCFLTILHTVGAWMAYDKPPPLHHTLNVDFLREQVEDGGFVASAAPWITTWKGELNTIWLPQTESSLTTLEERYGKKIHWIYLPRSRAVLPFDVVPDAWIKLAQEPRHYGQYSTVPSQTIGERIFKRD